MDLVNPGVVLIDPIYQKLTVGTVTDQNNAWSGQSRSYQQAYSAPVVVGQVMTYNDPDWSVFWAAGASRTSIPSSSALTVGKHVGEDSDTTRANETIGYIVIETSTSGTAQIEGLPYVAAVGGDTIRGIGNSPSFNYGYNAMANSKTAVGSLAGMDGGDGGWAVLYGNDPITPTGSTLKLAIDEDQQSDSERSHTTEQVAYLIIDPPHSTGSAATESPIVASGAINVGLTSKLNHASDRDAELASDVSTLPHMMQKMTAFHRLLIDSAIREMTKTVESTAGDLETTSNDLDASLDLLAADLLEP